MLDVGDGQRLAWAEWGSPSGVPLLVLHGGPGSGTSAALVRPFDGERFRIVTLDQRGCGRSRPHAGDAEVDLSTNTTAHLLGDLEALRAHLRIERWMVFGTSWGSVLGLAYAERWPERVDGLVLAGVALGRRSEIDWLYRGGLADAYPAEWERFRSLVRADDEGADVDPVEGYRRLLADPDPAVRRDAAARWTAWDWATASVAPGPLTGRWADPAFQLARARICTHFFAHDHWLGEDELLSGADRLADIPGALVNGRHDRQTPAATAEELHRAWPGSDLHLVDDAGHSTGDQGMAEAIGRAATRWPTVSDDAVRSAMGVVVRRRAGSSTLPIGEQ